MFFWLLFAIAKLHGFFVWGGGGGEEGGFMPMGSAAYGVLVM